MRLNLNRFRKNYLEKLTKKQVFNRRLVRCNYNLIIQNTNTIKVKNKLKYAN